MPKRRGRDKAQAGDQEYHKRGETPDGPRLALHCRSRWPSRHPRWRSPAKALACTAAAVQQPASPAAEHRHSNSASLAGAAPTWRATAAVSRAEQQPQWPGAAQLAAKPGAALQCLMHHSPMLCLQGPRAQGPRLCSRKLLLRRFTAEAIKPLLQAKMGPYSLLDLTIFSSRDQI